MIWSNFVYLFKTGALAGLSRLVRWLGFFETLHTQLFLFQQNWDPQHSSHHSSVPVSTVYILQGRFWAKRLETSGHWPGICTSSASRFLHISTNISSWGILGTYTWSFNSHHMDITGPFLVCLTLWLKN